MSIDVKVSHLFQLTNSSINISRVLHLVWSFKGISRSEIARRLNLDKSTITEIVSTLIQLGIIVESKPLISTPQGGRPPVGLSINGEFGVVAGIDLQPDHYKLIVIGLDGKILKSMRVHALARPDSIEKVLVEAIGNAQKISQELLKPLVGVGIGITGIIDSDSGYIYHSIPLQIFEPIALQTPVVQKTGVNITIDNDANCCAWGEKAFHSISKRKDQDFLFVLTELAGYSAKKERISGVGVGFSFVFGGKVYRGSNFTAGEFRSLFCKRGNNSQFSLKDEETYKIHTTPEIRRRFLRELSRHIALLSNSLNLPTIFIGGDIEPYADEFIPTLTQEQQRNWAYTGIYEVPLEVSLSTHGKNAVAIGAAGMMLEELFDVPALQ